MIKSLTVLLVALWQLSSSADAQQINFGDDNSEWANDGECDDKRFEGPGMTETILLDEDILHDSTDCSIAFSAGTIVVRRIQTSDLILNGINFGNDSGEWSNDGECDDPRFEGPGMTTTTLLADDIRKDATDCAKAYQEGSLILR